MVEVTIEGDKVVFEVEGWDKLWSLKSRLAIPLAHIKGAQADPTLAIGWWAGLRLGGTAIPTIFRAGTFYHEGGLVFWDVHNPEKTVVIDLEHEHYKKLIIEVADPQETVRLIRGALSPDSD